MWCRFGQEDAGEELLGLPILGIQI